MLHFRREVPEINLEVEVEVLLETCGKELRKVETV